MTTFEASAWITNLHQGSESNFIYLCLYLSISVSMYIYIYNISSVMSGLMWSSFLQNSKQTWMLCSVLDIMLSRAGPVCFHLLQRGETAAGCAAEWKQGFFKFSVSSIISSPDLQKDNLQIVWNQGAYSTWKLLTNPKFFTDLGEMEEICFQRNHWLMYPKGLPSIKKCMKF